MRDIAVHFGRAVFHQDFFRLAQSASRVANVVNDDALLALDVTNHGHLGNFACFFAALVHDAQWGADAFCQFPRAGNATNIR